MNAEARRSRFAHLPVLRPRVDILPVAQAAIWPDLSAVPEPFVMYGGTAVALRLGHRQSLDFDFFSAVPFRPTDLLDELAWLGRVAINESAQDHLTVTTEAGVRLSFLGGFMLRTVAEPSVAEDNGIVVASLFDLAGTTAKAILDRSEWKDYVDIGTLLRHGVTLPEAIAFATTIFEPLFEFPAAVFLRALAWFQDGTAPDVPADVRQELEQAVARTAFEEIPLVAAYSPSIRP